MLEHHPLDARSVDYKLGKCLFRGESTNVKQLLDHLPAGKRRELARVVEMIREGFAKAIAHRTMPRFRNGKLLKIVLFGSYARGDWSMIQSAATSPISTCSSS
jgi:hypothetical protein